MYSTENSIVFNKAASLFNDLQKALAQQPRTWEALPMSQVLGRLEIYAEILSDIQTHLTAQLIAGDDKNPAQSLAVTSVLEKSCEAFRRLIRQGSELVRAALMEGRREPGAEALVGDAVPVPQPGVSAATNESQTQGMPVS